MQDGQNQSQLIEAIKIQVEQELTKEFIKHYDHVLDSIKNDCEQILYSDLSTDDKIARLKYYFNEDQYMN